MRRWNGWGDDTVQYPLPEDAELFLTERVGRAVPLSDASLKEVLARVPGSRLPDHPLVDRSPVERLRHARGQSLPDWVALRSGQVQAFPDGVAHPVSTQEVRVLLLYAAEVGAEVIPYGGGTSVLGHITPRSGERPVLTLDMGRVGRLMSLDEKSQIAEFGAGAAGPDVEAGLRARGFTLGHFPQSFEFSTLGGWVSTRSSGQQSLRYGRIEHLFAGGRLQSPVGSLEIPGFPASAAGPDLREAVLGSEGRLGVLTEVKIRVSPLPERERFYIIFFQDWQQAVEAVRHAVQARVPLSMMRLSTVKETETQLVLAGHKRLVGWYEKGLARRGAGPGKCMLTFGVTGTRVQCRQALSQAREAFRQGIGFLAGRYLGRKWVETRFLVPYLRNTLWEKGYAVDTLETATDWDRVEGMIQGIESAIHGAFSRVGEGVHVFTHLSHLYPQGASVYTTCLFRLGGHHHETLARWEPMKEAASKAIVAQGGTISHQHGVGTDHRAYLAAEKGHLGMGAIEGLCRHFDPQGMMNPGKLI